MYQRWPKSLQQLLFPSWQLHALARNLYTLTLVLDPADDMSPRALGVLKVSLTEQAHAPVTTLNTHTPTSTACLHMPCL